MKLSPEQIKVIDHKGALLLSAGAGAGKTFVIIEYLKKYFGKIKLKAEHVDEQEEIKNILRSICVITFTNKATNEIYERIYRSFEEQAKDSKIFELIVQNLNYLFVGTIHSLCSYILRTHSILRSDQEHVDFFVIQEKLRRLVSQAIESLDENKEVFYFNEARILKTFTNVFNNASSRLNWRDVTTEDEGHFKHQWFELYELNFPLLEVDANKAWEKYYLELKEIFKISNLERRFDELSVFLLTTRKSPRKSESVDSKILNFFEELKEYQKEFKVFYPLIENYKVKKDFFKNFSDGLNKIFKFVDKHYYDDSYIGHTDLEYLLVKNIEKVSLNLEKIIVDEFQDTSFLQCEIIDKLIGSNESKLYVGDVKQAIYSFRGGEVEVFENAQRELPVLELSSNYRSQRKIVDFNNKLFSQIFSKITVNQVAHEQGGEVNFYNGNLDLSSSRIEQLREAEAKILSKVIRENITKDEFKTFAVLYKNLTGISVLVEELSKEKIPFVAEIKIPNDGEPVLNIFQYLLKSLLSVENIEEFEKSLFFINGIIHFFNGKENVEKSDLEIFQENLKLHGLYLSFILFLSQKSIVISKYDVNLLLIKQACEAFEEIPARIFQYLNSIKGEKVKVYLQTEIKDKYVELMTIHSSKGLEFDFVVVADLHSSNRSPSDSSLIIKNNNGLKLKNYSGEDEQTPQYYFNKIAEKTKAIEEEKRLFYVAATRACKSLNFVVLESSPFKEDGRWANLLRKNWKIKSNIVEITMDTDKSIKSAYIKYDLGFRNKKLNKAFKIFPDISVTGLSKLSVCSHLFYLSEVLKIRDQDLRSMDKLFIDSELSPKSSLSRGIKLHKQLEKLVLGEKISGGKDSEIISWVENQLVEFEGFEKYTERNIKFSFKKFMVSGTADVFFINREQKKLVVWDFKTGDVTKHLESYMAQLKIYLYGITQVFELNKYDSSAYIVSLDDKKKLSAKTSNESLSGFIADLFENRTDYSLKNLDYCSDCSHQLICSRK